MSEKELTKGVDCVIRILPEGINIRDFIDVNEKMIEDVDYAELETCCPDPEIDRNDLLNNFNLNKYGM